MQKSISPSLIFLTFVAIAHVLLILDVEAKNTALITQTCNQIPNTELCISNLNSDPKIDEAKDVFDLANILTSNVLDLEVKVENHILGLLRNRGITEKVRSLLLSCMTTYKEDVKFGITRIIGLVARKEFGLAAGSMERVVAQAEKCGESFFNAKVKSPIAEDTKALDDLSLVAYGVIKNIQFYYPPPSPNKPPSANNV